MEARRNPAFAAVLAQTDLCLADGVGLLWAARRLGQPLPERVTGSDSVPLIAQHAAERGWRLYLLGAGPGIAPRTSEILRGRYPGLRVVGAYGGTPATRMLRRSLRVFGRLSPISFLWRMARPSRICGSVSIGKRWVFR